MVVVVVVVLVLVVVVVGVVALARDIHVGSQPATATAVQKMQNTHAHEDGNAHLRLIALGMLLLHRPCPSATCKQLEAPAAARAAMSRCSG